MERKLRLALAGVLLVFLVLGCTAPGAGNLSASAPTVCAGGYRSDASGTWVPGYWTNGTWVELPSLGGIEASVTSVCLSGSDVYFAGWCWSGDNSNTQAPGYWKNGAWAGPTQGTSFFATTSLLLAGSDVYVGGCGYPPKSGTLLAPYYWVNGGQVQLPSGTGGEVTTLAGGGSVLYAGGYNMIKGPGPKDPPVQYPGFWTNGVWSSLITTQYGGTVNSMVIERGVIYAGGFQGMAPSPSDPQTPLSQAGYWQGGSWVPLSDTGAGSNVVISIAVSAGVAYACGTVNSVPGYWIGGAWFPLPQEATVTSIAFSGTDVYVGGSMGSTPGYWRNGAWTPLDAPNGGQVTALAVR